MKVRIQLRGIATEGRARRQTEKGARSPLKGSICAAVSRLCAPLKEPARHKSNRIPAGRLTLHKGLAIPAALGGKLRHGTLKGAAYGTQGRVWRAKACTQLPRCWLQPRLQVL